MNTLKIEYSQRKSRLTKAILMQAVLQNETGDESTLFVGETDIPTPGDGEVLIVVCSTALNRMDLLQCKG